MSFIFGAGLEKKTPVSEALGALGGFAISIPGTAAMLFPKAAIAICCSHFGLGAALAATALTAAVVATGVLAAIGLLFAVGTLISKYRFMGAVGAFCAPYIAMRALSTVFGSQGWLATAGLAIPAFATVGGRAVGGFIGSIRNVSL